MSKRFDMVNFEYLGSGERKGYSMYIHVKDKYQRPTLGLSLDQESYKVTDLENLYLFPGEFGFRGFYFYENLVIELHGDDGMWWFVGAMNIYHWKNYQNFIANIDRE